MPFRFSYICSLLDKLHHIFARHPPYLPRDVQQMSTRVIMLWSKKHEFRMKNDVDGFLLLSYLFPERHDGRVYGLSERELARVIGRAFCLSTAQFQAMLNKASAGDLSDLGHRVEQVTQERDRLPYSRAYVTPIEEIEDVLSLLAKRHSIASHPSQSDQQKSLSSVLTDKLAPLYLSLLPTERKWLTRLILKSYAPIVMPEDLVFSLYHPLLAGLIRIFDLKAALRFCHRLEGETEPEANQNGSPQDQSPPQDPGVVAPAELPNTDGVGGPNNTEDVPVIQDALVQPGPRESSKEPRAVPTLVMPTSSKVQEGTSSNSSTTLSPRNWFVQPLSDITNCAVNKPATKAQGEKSPISSPFVSKSASQANISAPQAPSTTARPSDLARTESSCTKTGRHCLFYKKDVGLLPPLSRTAAIQELLEKHKAAPMAIEIFLEGKIGGRRQILLVDPTANGVEDAVEKLRATHTYDARGRKRWVDIYDWRLLGFFNEHGSCRESKPEGWRRYWVGTV